VWSAPLRFREATAAADAAAALEVAGWSAVWMTGGLDDPFHRVTELLAATSRVAVATGILSIWTMDAADVASRVAALDDPDGRFLLGLGVSHAQFVDRDDPGRYTRPLTRLSAYLDALDSTGEPRVAADRRVLAALGPRMLELASRRSLGAHPYLTTPEHTATARAAMGPTAFLAPTQMTLLEPDATRARETARGILGMYLRQPNYVQSWLRLGFTEDDVASGGSDRLVDALVAWGDAERVAARLREHVAAGADHVAVSMLAPGATWRDQPLPVADWVTLAAALA
jgi:probable F420-dependent oxidoreductase